MKFFRLNVEDPSEPIRSFTTSLFCKISSRVAFIKKAEFSVLALDCSGINEDATADQVAMEISDHGSDVPRGIGAIC